LIEAADRPGLERLLRYCARPAFASERLSWDGSDQPARAARPARRAILAHLDEPTTPPPLAPRARHPPELDAAFTLGFDQSPWWDSTAAASEPSFHFDQTLN
jgi:hypothetical protein